jgi:hypothetical protein
MEDTKDTIGETVWEVLRGEDGDDVFAEIIGHGVTTFDPEDSMRHDDGSVTVGGSTTLFVKTEEEIRALVKALEGLLGDATVTELKSS